MSEDTLVTLAIWSHSHAPPLQPPADVNFDLRRVPNPPKHIRDHYDGRSKRLREHLLHDATFANLLQSAMEEILQFVKEHGCEAPSRQTSHQPEQTCFVAEDETVATPATGSSERTASDDSKNEDHASQVENTDDEEAQAQTVSQSTEYDSIQEEPDSPTSAQPREIESDSSRLLRINVSCFCERGRHRSVAFAQELGRMAWPRTWEVDVQHRDVDGQVKKENSRKGRSVRRGGRTGLAFGIGPDGDEP